MQQGILFSRKSSLKNMWIIIYTMLSCTVFDFIYSLCIFILYSPECTPQRIPYWLDSTFKFMDRFIAYYLWLYPLLWMFWPTKKNLEKEKKYRRTMKYLYGSINGSGRQTKTRMTGGGNAMMTSAGSYSALYASNGMMGVVLDGPMMSEPNVELMSDDEEFDEDNSSEESDTDKNNFTGSHDISAQDYAGFNPTEGFTLKKKKEYRHSVQEGRPSQASDMSGRPSVASSKSSVNDMRFNDGSPDMRQGRMSESSNRSSINKRRWSTNSDNLSDSGVNSSTHRK